MIVSDEGQAKVFLIYILFGMLCIMLADLFSVFSKHFGATKTKVNLIDALYFVLAFCIILYAGVKFNFGALRYYQIFGLVIGMALHKLLLSNICRRVFEILLAITCKVIRTFLRLLWKAVAFVLRCVFSVTEFVEERIIRVGHKAKRYTQKVKTKKRKRKETVKKRLKMI